MRTERTLAFLLLFILSPVMLLIAGLVAATSKGPPFFLQQRVGKDGHLFWIFKFRTMTVDRGEDDSELTVDGNPRVTLVGRFLRFFKLDELPQLLNVLFGEMRFVGPRPEVLRYVEYYTEEQLAALSVPPGITDVASIYYRNESEELAAQDEPEQYYVDVVLPRKLALNLAYMAVRSPWNDVKVVLLTIVSAITPGFVTRAIRRSIERRYLGEDDE